MDTTQKKSLPLQKGKKRKKNQGKQSSDNAISSLEDLGNKILLKYAIKIMDSLDTPQKLNKQNTSNNILPQISSTQEIDPQNTKNKTQKENIEDIKNQRKLIKINEKTYTKIDNINKFLNKKLKEVICTKCKNRQRTENNSKDSVTKSGTTAGFFGSSVGGAINAIKNIGAVGKNKLSNFKDKIKTIKEKPKILSDNIKKYLTKKYITPNLLPSPRQQTPQTLPDNSNDEQDRSIKKIDKKNIKSKAFRDRTLPKNTPKISVQKPLGNEASNSVIKKSFTKLTNNSSLLRNAAPRFITAMGGSAAITSMAILAAKVLAIVAVIAGAAGLGYLIYDSMIRPWMDKLAKDAEDSLQDVNKETTQKDVVTDTGEKVYEKVDKQGQKTYVTESQMQSELDQMTNEEKKQYEAGEGPSYNQAKNVKNIHSGMMQGQVLASGSSIENINKQATEEKQRREKMSPGDRAFEDYSRQIADFDAGFREKLAKTMTAWGKTGGADTTLAGGRTHFEGVLESLLTQHQLLIDKIRNDDNLKPEQREELANLTPLFEGAFGREKGEGSDPDVDISAILGYDLPNGEGLVFDWANSSENIEENRNKINAEFGNPGQQLPAIQALYKDPQANKLSSTPESVKDTFSESIQASSRTSSVDQKPQASNTAQTNISTTSPQPIAPSTETSGDTLQTQTLALNTQIPGQQTQKRNENIGQPPVININQEQGTKVPRRTADVVSGGSAAPDSSGLEYYYCRDVRSATGSSGVTG